MLSQQRHDPSSSGRCSRNTHRAGVLLFAHLTQKDDQPAVSHPWPVKHPLFNFSLKPKPPSLGAMTSEVRMPSVLVTQLGKVGCQAQSLFLNWRDLGWN